MEFVSSKSLATFDHALKDASELIEHFDALNTQPPPAHTEVLKRASLVMALAALESYFEDRLQEAVDAVCRGRGDEDVLARFLRNSLVADLKTFHTPSTDRVRPMFEKYLGVDITEAWTWNHMEPSAARTQLNSLCRKRGDIAHRSLRPVPGQPHKHAVTRDDMRRHLHFIRELAVATDRFLAKVA